MFALEIVDAYIFALFLSTYFFPHSQNMKFAVEVPHGQAVLCTIIFLILPYRSHLRLVASNRRFHTH